MTILLHASRFWAAAQAVRHSEQAFPACKHTPNPARAPSRPHLEMRWHLDASGRLTCTWLLVSETASAGSNEEEGKPPPWLLVFVGTENYQTYAKRQ